MEIENVKQKMKEYAQILVDLHSEGIVRTYNSPVGDYAEWLVSNKLGLELQPNSKKGYDAIDTITGIKYQVKSRWMHPGKNSKQLNVIRNYEENQFDYLITIIFGNAFEVEEAYLIPHHLIKKCFPFKKHQNGFVVNLTAEFLKEAEIKDITGKFI